MLASNPDRWDLRVETDGRLVLVAKNHDNDHWRDVATFERGISLAELVKTKLNG